MKNKTMKYYKTNKNKTRKKYLKPSLKYLRIGYPLYAAKKHEGDKLLEYKRKMELKTGDHCLLDNSSWFGDLNVAKSYKKNDTHIYKWKIKTPTNLLKITHNNETFINQIFKNTRIKLVPNISLSNSQKSLIKYTHPYINMTDNQKALYEFQFAFGYITIKEQFEFLKLVEYLIKHSFIKIDTREGNSIVKKLRFKINYYKISSIIPKNIKRLYIGVKIEDSNSNYITNNMIENSTIKTVCYNCNIKFEQYLYVKFKSGTETYRLYRINNIIEIINNNEYMNSDYIRVIIKFYYPEYENLQFIACIFVNLIEPFQDENYCVY